MGVKILSLFDGMACGMIAMQLADVEVESYDAYEIDKYAIKTAQHNFPMIKEHGDVFDADFTQYEGVDFLVGGSPCTYWSIAQTKNRETVASGMGWELFSQYVRALHEAKPKYFIYENNKSMSKQIRASIDKAFGFEAALINSALVSAQNRQRLYWVGRRNEDGTYSKVNVEQPADRGILLKDVLDSAVARDLTCNDKAYTLTASYDGACAWNTIERHQRNMVAEPINTDANGKAFCVTSRYYKGFGNNPGKCLEKHRDSMAAEPLVTTKNGKSFAITANYVHIQDYPNDYAAHTIEKSVKPLVAEPINVTADGKSQTLKAQYTKNNVDNFCCYTSTYGASGVAEPVCVAERGRMYCGQPQHYEARTDGKTNTLTSVEKDNRVAEPINVTADGKAQCLRATCYKDGIRNIIANEVDKKTGVAEPINDIYQVGAMPRPDGEISTSAGFRIYSTEAKGRYLCANGGGAGAKTGLYAMHLDGFIPGERTVGSQMEFLGGINGRHEKWLEDGKNYSRNFSQGHRLYGVNGKSVTQTAQACGYAGNTGLYAIPTMPVKEATAKGYTEIECGDCVDLSMPNSKTRRGRNMADKANCMQTSNEFYQYVGYVIEFDDDGRPIKAIGKDGKEITIYEVKDGKITIKGKQYPIKLKDGFYIIRKLTVSECKRLQTVPEWYEFPVSNSQAYKMLGNGWTCEVIAHLIRSCMAEQWGGVDG